MKIVETYYVIDGKADKDYKISDLPSDVSASNIIDIVRNYSTNFSELSIHREREETEEELNIRIAKQEKASKLMKEKRYKTYLELKNEFENLPQG